MKHHIETWTYVTASHGILDDNPIPVGVPQLGCSQVGLDLPSLSPSHHTVNQHLITCHIKTMLLNSTSHHMSNQMRSQVPQGAGALISTSSAFLAPPSLLVPSYVAPSTSSHDIVNSCRT